MASKSIVLSLEVAWSSAKKQIADFAQSTKTVGTDLSKAWEKFGSTISRMDQTGATRSLLDMVKGLNAVKGGFSDLTAGAKASGQSLDEARKKLQDYRLEAEKANRQFQVANGVANWYAKNGGNPKVVAQALNNRNAAQAQAAAAQGAVATQQGVVSGMAAAGTAGTLGVLAGVGALGFGAYRLGQFLADTGTEQTQYGAATQAKYQSVAQGHSLSVGQGNLTPAIADYYLGKEHPHDLKDALDENNLSYRWNRMWAAWKPSSDLTVDNDWNMFKASSPEAKAYQRAQMAEAVKNLEDNAVASHATEVLAASEYVGASASNTSFMRRMGLGEHERTSLLAGIGADTGFRFGPDAIRDMISNIASAGAGRGGETLAGGALKMVIAGFEPGAAAQLSAGFAAGGRAKDAQAALVSTTMDRFVAEKAGTFTAGNYLGGNGITSGLGLLDYMTKGYTGSPAEQAYQEKYREASLSGLGSVMGGGPGADSYQKYTSLARALTNIRGTGLGLASANRLSSMSGVDVLSAYRGELTDSDRAFGLTPALIKRQFEQNLNGLGARGGGLFETGTDPTSQIYRRMMKEGVQAVLMDPKTDLEAAGNVLQSMAPGMFPAQAAATQFAKAMRQTGTPALLTRPEASSPNEALDRVLDTDPADSSLSQRIEQAQIKQQFQLINTAQTNVREALDKFAKDLNKVFDTVKLPSPTPPRGR